MADICTAFTKCSTGEHYSLSISGRTIALHQDDLTPLEPEEIDQFLRFALRAKQFDLSMILNRVIVGEEATNLKAYNLLGPGLAVTKNNIGITYVNVLNGLNGERELDTDWQTLPAAFTGVELLRVQAKSLVAADDPVFRRVTLVVR